MKTPIFTRYIMRTIIFNILSLLIFCNSVYCKKNNDRIHTHEKLLKPITNTAVIETKLLYHQGKFEKSLKKGIKILSSKEILNPIDSFYSFHTLANNFYNLNAYNTALYYAKKALEIGNRINFENKPNDVWIAQIYHNIGQYDSSIVYLEKEIKRASSAKDTSSFLKYCNNLGWSYYKNNQKNKAIEYYTKIIEFKNAKNYPIAYGVARGNFGLILFENQDYKNSLPYFKIDAELNRGRLWSAHFGAKYRIAQCYFYLNEYRKSELTLLEVLKIVISIM